MHFLTSFGWQALITVHRALKEYEPEDGRSLEEPVHFAERTEVEILIPAAGSPDVDDPTGWKAAEALIGFIDDAPSDMAENHDHYLYGQPKA